VLYVAILLWQLYIKQTTMNNSKQIIPDFTEDLVGFMIQMMLTIMRFPRAPFALVPLSKKDERNCGADAKIDSVSPIYLQFKRSFAYPSDSNAKFLSDRAKLNLNNDPRVLYFDLRKKEPSHSDFQHNILFKLRQRLQINGIGDAAYIAPLFINRSAYLLAVHFSSLVNWRPWRLFYLDPFFEREFNIVTSTGSIRFQNCPVLREHIAIPPHVAVSTHKHRYSYLENGRQTCFHSPSFLKETPNLGQFIYDFIRFKDGQPTTEMINFNESMIFLNELSNDIFNIYYERKNYDNPFFKLDSWPDFGEKLKLSYDIEQYLLIKYRNE
jgi:hypothetical protein